MKLVGITYDLRDDYLSQGNSKEETAEFDSLETITAIDKALQQQGFMTERIGNLSQLLAALVAGKRWDVVFNIAEGQYGVARESQVPAVLDAYQIPYLFSDPLTLAICLDKGISKQIVRDAGMATAPFWVLNALDEIDLHAQNFTFPLFVKPIAEGSSKGIHEHAKVEALPALKLACQGLWQTFKQPVLAEIFLPGREFTVGIIGTGKHAEVFGVMEIKLNALAEQSGYTFLNKQEWRQRVTIQLANDDIAQAAGGVALAAWQALRCRDAGRIDIRLDVTGEPCFLEANPLAGLHPLDSDLILIADKLGCSYNALIQRIMQSALARIQGRV